MARPLNPAREALGRQAAAEYKAGDTIRAIARRHHLGYSTARSLLIRAGVGLRTRGGANRKAAV